MSTQFTTSPEVATFVNYFTIGRNKSAGTAKEYSRDLMRFSRFIDPTPLIDATTEQIELWRDALTTEGKNKPQSVRRKLAAVSSFFKWRRKKKMRADNPFDAVEMPDVGKRLPKVMTTDEVQQILEARVSHRRLGELQDTRNHAMMEVLYGSGLRRAEVCGLDMDDVDLKERTVRVRHGKGDRERYSFLSEPAVEAIAAYLAIRQPCEDPALFLTIRRKRITPRQLWVVFSLIRKAANLRKHVVPHTMRHAFATHLYEGGADIRAIQELLGHSSIATTQIYAHVGMDRKRSVYEMAHPRAKIAPHDIIAE
jgi:integrase/recombinase XerC